VLLIFRPLLEPALEDFLLPAGQLLVRLRRRHLLVVIGAEDSFHQRTIPGFSRDEGPGLDRVSSHVKPHVGLATALVRTVAQKAVVGQNRPYISIELDLRGPVAGASRIAAHGGDPDDGRDGDWQPHPKGEAQAQHGGGVAAAGHSAVLVVSSTLTQPAWVL